MAERNAAVGSSSHPTSFFSTSLDNPYLLHLGTVREIPIRLHPTFFVLLGISALTGLANGLEFVALVCILYGPVLLGTIVVHELGHAFMTLHLGSAVDSILLWPLGGLCLCGAAPGSWGDLKVAVAGPATHIPMAFFWWAILGLAEAGDGWRFGATVALNAIFMNVYLCAFNLLLPAYPLDGGRVMAAVLSIRGMEPNKAGKITSGTAIVIALGLLAYGIWALFVAGDPHAIMCCLVAVFILQNSKQLYDLAVAGRVIEHPLFAREAQARQAYPLFGKDDSGP